MRPAVTFQLYCSIGIFDGENFVLKLSAMLEMFKAFITFTFEENSVYVIVNIHFSICNT